MSVVCGVPESTAVETLDSAITLFEAAQTWRPQLVIMQCSRPNWAIAWC